VTDFRRANSASIRIELRFKAAILTTTLRILIAEAFAVHIAIVIFLYLPAVTVLAITEVP